MNRIDIRDTVHAFVSQLLDGNSAFDDNRSLLDLGLDQQEIEDLIFGLEDHFGLTAFTRDEDFILGSATTVNELSGYMLELSRQ